MKFLTYIGIVSMELTKIIGKIKPYMKAEINGGINFSVCEGLSPEFNLVNDHLLRPLKVLNITPPAGNTIRDE